MRAINLLPRDDYFKRRKQQQSVQWVVVVPVILVVLISGALSIMFLSASGTVKDRKAELASLNAQLAAIPTPNASKVQSQTALGTEKQARITAINAALSRRVAWDRVFRELSLVLPNDVWLTDLSAKAPVSPALAGAAPPPTTNIAASGFILDGYTYSQAAVARLLGRISVIPDLDNVQLVKSKLQTQGGQNVVNFTIAADLRQLGTGS
jgi:Tfp pilus assembly protein PilN